jgi:hypothetical protein
MNLNLRAYCLVGLGNVKNLTGILEELATSEVSFVSGTGLIIATFMSELNVSDIEQRLNKDEKSYIVFEMTPGFFSANIRDDKFQNTLFGGKIDNTEFYQNIQDSLDIFKQMDLFKDIEDMHEGEEDDFMTIIDFMKKSHKKEEVEPDLDEILDKISKVGFENLSDKEKVLLEKYSKK